MGVVDFDPEKWSRANACEADRPVAKVANLAKLGPDIAGLSQLSQLSQVAPLPTDLRDGLVALRRMRAPRGICAERWPAVVADAVVLADVGWAAKALALGWSALDLFGAVTDPLGDPYCDGLAVWLVGRKLLAMTGTCATADTGNGRAYFNRLERDGTRLLWELGR